MSEEAGEISPTAWDKLMEEVSWLREAYTHKCSEVGYLSGETDRMKWLYDQSCEQIISLKAQNEHLRKELDESEFLRKKLTEQVDEPKIEQCKKRHHNRGGRFQNYRNLSLNLKKNNNNGNGDSNDNDKRNKDAKNSQWDSADEREKSSDDEEVVTRGFCCDDNDVIIIKGFCRDDDNDEDVVVARGLCCNNDAKRFLPR
ncbi:hypothetical protein RhiirA1_531950 [Rhizophagus irregularis]|uniref:Uncharacterized protein n=1 Tax=Rhizophagus irregularis TaxID=588596 RepID=A0A2I1FAF2_9GLOM|nr:hypothetical protein RhiirA1_531950 [Rhizophagus irregularis]PKY31344.1 hypothetical protein RhiirB3_531539 [Rhizophagus irregularis]